METRVPQGAAALTPSAVCETNVKAFEGCAKKRRDGSFQAYPDPGSGGDPWTIGWGSTGPDIKPGLVWTQAQCDARLHRDLTAFGAKVWALVANVPTSQAQFDALVSFAYNVGIARLEGATLLKLHRRGEFASAAAQFAMWNKASGRVMAGLTRRRAAEAAIYRSARP